MRILAIGDIHGCLTALDALLALVDPAGDDLLVTLGDYVDRGPDSRGVVELLLELRAKRRVVSLLGNHEQMMLEARYDPVIRASWLIYGGASTLHSYGAGDRPDMEAVPAEHWDFFDRDCIDWYETDSHFFVHAGVYPELPLDAQPISILRWEKFHAPLPHFSGKVMVCGHTLQPGGIPRNVGHAVCIDTGVYADGWLTCLDAASGHYWQANERGQTREGTLGDVGSDVPES